MRLFPLYSCTLHTVAFWSLWTHKILFLTQWAHLIYLSLKNSWHSLFDVQCCENCVLYIFFLFRCCYFKQEVNPVSITSPLLEAVFHLIFKCFPINLYTEGSLKSCELGIIFNNQLHLIHEKTEIQRSLVVALVQFFNRYLLGLNPMSFFYSAPIYLKWLIWQACQVSL